MKVTVKDKFLNVRVGKPSVNAPCFQFIAPGSEIEVDGKLYKGDLFRGIDIWLRDEADNYYWSGGVSRQLNDEVDTASLLDYGDKCILPANVKATKGRNIKVGILDTGCFRHNAFNQIIIAGKNFVDNNEDFKDISNGSHGTFVSGIIAAGNISGAVMTGVAPEVNLVIAKITAESDIIDVNPILEGLEWLIEQKPDIINCSFDFSAAGNLNGFQQIFSSQQAKSILWVAAGQDNEGLFNNTIYFPATEENFVAIGSLRKEVLSGRNISDINPKIRYVLNEVSFTSTNRFNAYKQNVGSSFASAYLTAHLALIKSHLLVESPGNAGPGNCISFLDQQIPRMNVLEFSEKPFSIFLK